MVQNANCQKAVSAGQSLVALLAILMAYSQPSRASSASLAEPPSASSAVVQSCGGGGGGGGDVCSFTTGCTAFCCSGSGSCYYGFADGFNC
jgi:hypothetical protein